MSWTIDEALADPLVHVVNRDDARRVYRVRIGDLKTVVSIRLMKPRSDGWVDFVQSHAIKTPKQAGPYWTSRPSNSSAPAALHQAISGLTSYYKEAVEEAARQMKTGWFWVDREMIA